MIIACAVLLCAVQAFAQVEYPFQDPNLPEEARLDNAVSLMTVEEKIATIVGQGVPRLGHFSVFIMGETSV